MPLSSSSPHAEARPPVAGPCPSFREIFASEARYVWRSLLALGVGESDVPDASQQVFVVLQKKLSQLNDGCALRTFIYGICLRVASDYRNRAHVRRERLCAAPPEPRMAGDQETIAVHRQALERLQDALAALEAPQREVFVLYEIEEMSMADVARTVGCPLQTAYSRLHAARKTVAAALGEHLEGL